MKNEGDYVNLGDPIFVISNLNELWLQLDAYEHDINWLRPNQNVNFSIATNLSTIYLGKIGFIEQVMDAKTHSVKIRVEVSNESNVLKPGYLANAIINVSINARGQVVDKEIKTYENLPLLIPQTAALLTGKRAMVYVKSIKNNKTLFEAREVKLGPKVGSHYIVISGLKEGEEVVWSGNFKIDSAMELAGKFSMMSLEDETENFQNEEAIIFITVFDKYFQLQTSLAKDDFNNSIIFYKEYYNIIKQLNFKHDSFSSEKIIKWKSIKDKILNNENFDIKTITDLRNHFEVLSNNMISVVETYGNAASFVFYKAYCPMTFDNKGSFWLQKQGQIDNPYFGAAMLRCGEIKSTYNPISVDGE